MICHVAGCEGFAKRCFRARHVQHGQRGGARAVVTVHACADHWPAVAGGDADRAEIRQVHAFLGRALAGKSAKPGKRASR